MLCLDGLKLLSSWNWPVPFSMRRGGLRCRSGSLLLCKGRGVHLLYEGQGDCGGEAGGHSCGDRRRPQLRGPSEAETKAVMAFGDDVRSLAAVCGC